MVGLILPEWAWLACSDAIPVRKGTCRTRDACIMARRVGSGWVGPGRIGSGRIGLGRIRSGQVESGRVGSVVLILVGVHNLHDKPSGAASNPGLQASHLD